jgi:murein DD-endopeptidase MepM/ murein hydrolase activator NlpD
MRLLVTFLATLLCVLTAAPSSAETVPAPARQGVWPLSPRPQVLSGFDPPATTWGAGHRGVDLLGHAGQPVHASLGGTVTFAGTIAGRGVVVVDHGGVRTTYEPVSASLAVGDPVGRGGVIGTLQRAGSHCFPRACLHWGLLRGDTYLNPLTLVGAGPIRLLPLDGGLVGPTGPAAPALSSRSVGGWAHRAV